MEQFWNFIAYLLCNSPIFLSVFNNLWGFKKIKYTFVTQSIECQIIMYCIIQNPCQLSFLFPISIICPKGTFTSFLIMNSALFAARTDFVQWPAGLGVLNISLKREHWIPSRRIIWVRRKWKKDQSIFVKNLGSGTISFWDGSLALNPTFFFWGALFFQGRPILRIFHESLCLHPIIIRPISTAVQWTAALPQLR